MKNPMVKITAQPGGYLIRVGPFGIPPRKDVVFIAQRADESRAFRAFERAAAWLAAGRK